MYNFRIYDTQSQYDQDKNIVYPELSLIKDSDTIVSKSNNISKTYIINYEIPQEGASMNGKIYMLTRCDLLKSVKIDGVDIPLDDKARTPYIFSGQSNEEKFEELINLITISGEPNPAYVLLLDDTEYGPGKTGTIEIEWNSDITENSMYGAFMASTGVSEIPENLLENFIEFTDMSAIFANTPLKLIPNKLFSNHKKVTKFANTFSNCSFITNQAPIDDGGTPIYNRSGSGKEGYAVVTDFSGCFQGCTGMSDYNSIPSSWGGGKA